MAIRSFLAFELPPGIKNTLTEVLKQIKNYDLVIKWVPLTNIHLTMIFLGNINEEDIPAMGKEIEKTCAQTEPFTISLKDVGCFPHKRNPRVLWLGLESDIERLAFFRDELRNRLIPFGLTPEKRPFKPHLTLGRFKKRDKRNMPKLEKIFETYQEIDGSEQTLIELAQFRSDLRPGGAVYTKIGSWKLGG